MKKTLFSLAIVSMALVSCKKEKNEVDDFSRELSLEAAYHSTSHVFSSKIKLSLARRNSAYHKCYAQLKSQRR